MMWCFSTSPKTVISSFGNEVHGCWVFSTQFSPLTSTVCCVRGGRSRWGNENMPKRGSFFRGFYCKFFVFEVPVLFLFYSLCISSPCFLKRTFYNLYIFWVFFLPSSSCLPFLSPSFHFISEERCILLCWCVFTNECWWPLGTAEIGFLEVGG